MTGHVGAGYLNVTAKRDDPQTEFKTKRVELELDEGVFVIYDKAP